MNKGTRPQVKDGLWNRAKVEVKDDGKIKEKRFIH